MVYKGLVWLMVSAPLLVFADQGNAFESKICLLDSPTVKVGKHDTIRISSKYGSREFRLEEKAGHFNIYQKIDGQNLGYAGYLYKHEYDSLKATVSLESYLRERFMNESMSHLAPSFNTKPRRRRRRESLR